jgi:hypothetical protein
VSFLRSHPVGAVVLGIGIGLVFGAQLKRLPGVSKLPSA